MKQRHIRIYAPKGVKLSAWKDQNTARVQSFSLRVAHPARRDAIDVFYDKGQEGLIIEEVLRYAGVIGVCRQGSNLDEVGIAH